mgnify:CR=1 FL=1
MSIVNWTPFRDMEGFFDRYYNALGRAPFAGDNPELRKTLEWRPSVDISETSKHYLIKAELPEVEKDDVDVAVENGVLTISGERRYEVEEETETKHRIESMYGRFSRSFTLPSDADESRISAKSKNGVLKVRIPKMEAVKEKAVRVAVE